MDGWVNEQRKRQLMYMFYYIIQNVHLDTTVHNVPIPVYILTTGRTAWANVIVQKNNVILCSGVQLTAHQVNISTWHNKMTEILSPLSALNIYIYFNMWSTSIKSGIKSPLGKWDLSLFKWRTRTFPREDNSEIHRRRQTFLLKYQMSQFQPKR